MKSQEYSAPEGFYYTRDHEWVKVEGDVCRIGITDYAQKSLHEVVFVDLPKLGRVSRTESLGTVESVKAVSDYFAPVSGEIVEVNKALESRPDLINQSPYGDGWIAIIKPSALETELAGLMNSKMYSEFLRSLTEK
ncbi:MAG: glycine cleavage system protein GcvH [Candidatus Bathyarchaeia archaeon]